MLRHIARALSAKLDHSRFNLVLVTLADRYVHMPALVRLTVDTPDTKYLEENALISYDHLFKRAFDTRRTKGGRWAWWLEVIGLVVFWYWYGNVLANCGSWQKALMFLLVSHAATSPLHIQVCPKRCKLC